MKNTFVTAEQLERIAAEFPTPFHLYDERGIRENARRLLKAFSWNKGYREFFAVKATPNPTILRILRDEGCGVDCSSRTELMLADAVGFGGNEIMFSSNQTPDNEYILARKLNATINLDDYGQIDSLEHAAGIPETISMRFNPGGDFVINNSIMDRPGDSKFGCTEEQIISGYKRLYALGARRFGLHAFLASNTITNEYYPAVARTLFELANHIKKETGIHVSFVNLSGGVGIPYRPEQEPCNIEIIADGVHKAYVECGMEDVSICTELGRYMLGPYGCLITRCIHKKQTYKDYVGVDACAANLMRPAIYKAYHHITVIGKENAAHDHLYDVVGSLCENNDKFCIDRYLPEIEVGDLLCIHDAGAHGFSMGYNYNGKLRSAELLLCEDGSVRLIRRAEVPADYFATLDIYPELSEKLMIRE